MYFKNSCRNTTIKLFNELKTEFRPSQIDYISDNLALNIFVFESVN